jgi:uracil-DNA glycosylase family 4
MSKEKQFLALKKEIKSCRICGGLFGFKPKPLVWGNFEAKIVQISQAPSLTAHKIQRPFSDKSGEKLKRDWYQIPDDVFYNPDNFYITAISHCYPGKAKNGDRSPPIGCAQRWLAKELELVNPKLFIVLGSQAASFLFPKNDFTRLVFQNQTLKNVPCYVIPHPSPRNIKWFKDNPGFEAKRLLELRRVIHQASQP